VPVGCTVIKYRAIRDPPLDDGATNRTIAELSPATAVTWRGALGRVIFVAADADETEITVRASSAGTVKTRP
jgi:hypothetical protein